MTTNDESEDRELLERYRRASDLDPRAPSAAVRAAILDEARRVAANLPNAAEDTNTQTPRKSRWKMTAWGTAAAALIAVLIIAPRFWNQPPAHIAAMSAIQTPFNQAASKTAPSEPAAELRPVVPVVPVPPPKLENLTPLARLNPADTPTLRRSVAPPPPEHIPEQSVEISELRRAEASVRPSGQQASLSSLTQARASAQSYTAGTESAQRSMDAATPLLSAAVAAGDMGKTTKLLDQGAHINDRDFTGRTPLLIAIGQDRVAAVRLLLSRGADPNAADQHGLTPLQLANQNQFKEIASLLLDAGAR